MHVKAEESLVEGLAAGVPRKARAVGREWNRHIVVSRRDDALRELLTERCGFDSQLGRSRLQCPLACS